MTNRSHVNDSPISTQEQLHSLSFLVSVGWQRCLQAYVSKSKWLRAITSLSLAAVGFISPYVWTFCLKLILDLECNDEAHGTRVWQVVVWIPTPRALSHPPLALGQKIPQFGEGGIPLFLCRNYIYCDICIGFLFFVDLVSFIQKRVLKSGLDP